MLHLADFSVRIARLFLFTNLLRLIDYDGFMLGGDGCYGAGRFEFRGSAIDGSAIDSFGYLGSSRHAVAGEPRLHGSKLTQAYDLGVGLSCCEQFLLGGGVRLGYKVKKLLSQLQIWFNVMRLAEIITQDSSIDATTTTRSTVRSTGHSLYGGALGIGVGASAKLKKQLSIDSGGSEVGVRYEL